MTFDFDEVVTDYPEDEYPRSGDYAAYREWIGEGARFLDRDDIPEHWQRFADDEVGTDLCGADIATMTRSEFDRL